MEVDAGMLYVNMTRPGTGFREIRKARNSAEFSAAHSNKEPKTL